MKRLTHLTARTAFTILSIYTHAANLPPAADFDSIDNTPYQIVDRGQDFALYRKLGIAENNFGVPVLQTNQFTLLENALHYQDAASGEWRQSEDLIESFPGGAIAQRGPHKAIFASDLNTQSVFDIQASDGKRIRGGVRAI